MSVFTKENLSYVWPHSLESINEAFDYIQDFCLNTKMLLVWETQWSIVNVACNCAVIKSTHLSGEVAIILEALKGEANKNRSN